MTADYQREIEQNLDYEKDAEKSRRKIDKCVSESTGGKIENMFSELSTDTPSVLVSCIYFKGYWNLNKKFNTEITRDAKFYCTKLKQPSTLKMMRKLDDYEYYSSNAKKFKCIKLYYEHRDFSMMITFSDKQYGLKDVI